MLVDALPPGQTSLLSVRNLTKSFGPIKVLKDVSFELKRGEIHALVGENGCGKSTFIKCLAGYHEAGEASEILVRGQPLPARFGAEQSLNMGFKIIHQNLGLVPTISVLENLALSHGYPTRFAWKIDWKAQKKRAIAALRAVGATVDPDARVSTLSVADRTLVALARCLQQAGGAINSESILVLDEPTAALPEAEVERLFKSLRGIAAGGAGIIYVSHRLNEILEIADSVTAMRDGRTVAAKPIAGLTERDLVHMILGRSLDTFLPETSHDDAVPAVGRPPILAAKGVSGVRLRHVDLDVKEGEIVGVAGLLGSGRSELARVLFGAQKLTGGVIELHGKKVKLGSPQDGLNHGIGYVPEDRIGKGGVPNMTVAQNITISTMRNFWSGIRLQKAKERKLAISVIREYSVRPPDPDALFGRLSGGNQQKIIIARAALPKPKLLLLDEPVQGVDIGSKTEIFGFIQRLASQGTGIVVIDSNFEDLARLCDRVVVLRNGRVTATLTGAERHADRISELVFSASGRA